jgi:hypothetical protein
MPPFMWSGVGAGDGVGAAMGRCGAGGIGHPPPKRDAGAARTRERSDRPASRRALLRVCQS